MKQEASSQRRRCISNSSRVESEAPWRCRRPGRRLLVLHQTAWSLGTPRPPEGQAGKTPLWILPHCLEASWTRQTCPAVPPCRRTPVGGPSVERGGGESAGLTRGGHTVEAGIWKTSASSFEMCKSAFTASLARNNNYGNWQRTVTLSAIFSFRKGLIIAKMPLKIRGSFMMLTALILMGNPSCELEWEKEQSDVSPVSVHSSQETTATLECSISL